MRAQCPLPAGGLRTAGRKSFTLLCKSSKVWYTAPIRCAPRQGRGPQGGRQHGKTTLHQRQHPVLAAILCPEHGHRPGKGQAPGHHPEEQEPHPHGGVPPGGAGLHRGRPPRHLLPHVGRRPGGVRGVVQRGLRPRRAHPLQAGEGHDQPGHQRLSGHAHPQPQRPLHL